MEIKTVVVDVLQRAGIVGRRGRRSTAPGDAAEVTGRARQRVLRELRHAAVLDGGGAGGSGDGRAGLRASIAEVGARVRARRELAEAADADRVPDWATEAAADAAEAPAASPAASPAVTKPAAPSAVKPARSAGTPEPKRAAVAPAAAKPARPAPAKRYSDRVAALRANGKTFAEAHSMAAAEDDAAHDAWIAAQQPAGAEAPKSRPLSAAAKRYADRVAGLQAEGEPFARAHSRAASEDEDAHDAWIAAQQTAAAG